MASLSPKTFSPTTKPQYQARQPTMPTSTFTSSFTLRKSATFSPASKRNTIMERRRGRPTPRLQICALQAGAVTSPSSRTQTATPYDMLEVPPTASEGEIKTAYRRLVRQYHPDRAPLHEKEASTNKFLQIHSAYSVLSDPCRRAQYDLQLSLTAFQSAGFKSRIPHTYAASTPSSNYCSPRSPFSNGRGRSWETDQCWC